jgi:hypothetical protein
MRAILAEFAPVPNPPESPVAPPAPDARPAAPGTEAVRAPQPPESGGRDGPEPTRFGDWEKNGRCIDF